MTRTVLLAAALILSGCAEPESAPAPTDAAADLGPPPACRGVQALLGCMCRYERADAGCAGACLSCRPGQLLRSICRADGTCQCFVNDERYCDCAVDPALARSCAASCCWTFLPNGLDASM